MDLENLIMESVPNFSEGRNSQIIDKILSAFRERDGVRLLDYSCDTDHNRMVASVVGSPQALRSAIVEAVGIAVELIDLNVHRGEHPRLGAADVIPFIPLRGCGMEEAVGLARATARDIAERYALPVFLYEKAAYAADRSNLADLRRGQFEGLDAKLLQPEWRPDFGPSRKHPRAGAAVVGARSPLIAFNVNLASEDIRVAKDIARRVRAAGGGLPCCKAIGLTLRSKGMVQVSMNLTDYRQTGMHHAYAAVAAEAQKLGVRLAGCELVGMAPQEAVADSLAYFLGIDNFNSQQILIQ
ncbi:MAG: glutamate formimidoyltransferase [Tannerellaceae bacterium]|nr:glutamate formimidoyltransferase [Tannerellaceae bacterium]